MEHIVAKGGTVWNICIVAKGGTVWKILWQKWETCVSDIVSLWGDSVEHIVAKVGNMCF